jgi:hypothetical protein
MSYEEIDVGSFANDPSADTAREAYQKVNTNFSKAAIQCASFVDTGGAIINPGISYVDTGLIVSITPLSSNSTLVVNFTCVMTAPPNQSGFFVKIQYKVGAGAWTDLLVGAATYHSTFRDTFSITGTNTVTVTGEAELASPGTSDIVQFKVQFAGRDAQNSTYESAGYKYIKAIEYLNE